MPRDSPEGHPAETREPMVKTLYRDFEADFKTITVSSLGAIPNFTLKNLSTIIGSNSKAVMNLWAKRLVLAALKGSFLLWIKAAPQNFELMQKTITMDELDDQDDEYENNENADIKLTNNIRELVNEEMKVSDFTLAEEEEKSVINLINDCENRDDSREIFIPNYGIKAQDPAEDLNGLTLPDNFVQAEKEEVSDMMKEKNLLDNET
jgi:hypothetical protein